MKDTRPFKDPKLFYNNEETGKISTWIRRPSEGNRRQYIGYFDTFHMAARAQDRAILCLNYKSATNFKASDYADDQELRVSMDQTAFLDMIRAEGRGKYKVVDKSPCYLNFRRMEMEMEDLRRLTKFTIREFVRHLGEHPSPSPEINEAANILLEIYAIQDAKHPAHKGEETDDSPSLDIPSSSEIISNIPKAKRSPTSRRGAADGAGPSSRTRSACKGKQTTTWARGIASQAIVKFDHRSHG